MKELFKKIFQTEGRVNRLKYFIHSSLSGLLFFISFITLSILMEVFEGILLWVSTSIVLSILIMAIISEICITIRRIHDINRSGSDYFLLLIPFYNIIFSLQLLFKKGTEGKNKYGSDPLSISYTVTEEIELPQLEEEKSYSALIIVSFIILIFGYFIFSFIDNQTFTESNNNLTPKFSLEDSISTLFKIENDILEKGNISKIKFIEGHNGYIISLDTAITILEFKDELKSFGFLEVSDKTSTMTNSEFVKHLKYKTFVELEDSISIEIGANYEAIKYFLVYLKENLLKKDFLVSIEFN